MIYLRTLVIAVGVTLPTLAVAQQGGLRGACMSDIKTLCGSVQPGGGRFPHARTSRAELSGCKCDRRPDAAAARRAEANASARPDGPAQDQIDFFATEICGALVS